MRSFKVNKDQSSIIIKSNKGNCRVGSLQKTSSLSVFKSKMSELRENALNKENYNFFVGDEHYKTDFFLRFKEPSKKLIYE